MTVAVRPASNSISSRQLADLLWSTDPKLNGYMFGSMSVLRKIIDAEWPLEHGLYSHKQTFVAAEKGHILGLLIGHTDDELELNFNVSVEQQSTLLGDKDSDHLKTALHWMDRLFPVPRQGSYYILEFAVSPQAQGEGIAGQLFKAAEAQAHERGCTRICLDVAADNEAVGFYQHIGFEVEVETRVPVLDEAHGIGLHLHMVRELAP